MRIYLLSPESVPMNPHLFPMFIDAWKGMGCEVVDRIEDCDVVLMDLHTRIFGYEQDDIYKLFLGMKPIATFDEFDKGGMSNLQWPYPLSSQQLDVFSHINNGRIKSVHFCRLLDKTKEYKNNLYPYEKPILYEEPIATEDELFNRKYDIVWIANTAPQREHLKKVLEINAKLKCKIILGAKKIPLQDWIDAHKQGKMFVSWSAGGFGDEKIQHLFSVAGIIKENNNQLFLHDFTHLENCIRPNTEPTREDIQTIVDVVNDKSRLYEIYCKGYEFVKKHYSKEYIANDIFKKIIKHCA